MTRPALARCAFLLLFGAAAYHPAAAQTAASDVRQAVAAARADVDTLASPRYAGRGYDRRGGAARAAAYLSGRFAEMGVVPFGRTFGRPYRDTTSVVDGVALAVDGTPLRLYTDFLPMPSVPAGWGAGDLVDVGFGLAMPGLDAYGARDVRGRVVIVSDTLPRLRPPGTPEAPVLLAAQLQTAAARGAVAVVVLADRQRLVYGAPRLDAPLPVFFVDRTAWPAAAQTEVPRRASFWVEARQRQPITGLNVVGMVRGRAVPDSFLVVTAHYDHLGAIATDAATTAPGDAASGRLVVFPGANDNASGTALLVALADAVRRAPLRYTVVFAAVGGEELGLLGSTALAADAPWPLARTRFLLNVDMAASGDGRVLVFGGQDHADALAQLRRVADALPGPPPTVLVPRETRPNSDHWPFARRGVPAFFLLTAGGPQPYHAPDDRAETLNWTAWEGAYRLSLGFLRCSESSSAGALRRRRRNSWRPARGRAACPCRRPSRCSWGASRR